MDKKQAKTLVDSSCTRATTTSSPKLVGVKSNKNCYLTNAQQTSFMGAKSILDESDPVSIPRLYNSTESSHVYTEASDKHLGATVVQETLNPVLPP